MGRIVLGQAPGETYHYGGYSIRLRSVGAAPGGLLTTEGKALPIGTVYEIASGPGTGQVWRATGPNTADQVLDVTAPPPPASGAPSWFESGSIAESIGLPPVYAGGAIPNFAVLAAGGVLLFLLLKKRR